jgi:hypothetical protein
MGTKWPSLVPRCVFIRLTYCMLRCTTVCKILTYIITNLALSKIEGVKRYKTDGVGYTSGIQPGVREDILGGT